MPKKNVGTSDLPPRRSVRLTSQSSTVSMPTKKTSAKAPSKAAPTSKKRVKAKEADEEEADEDKSATKPSPAKKSKTVLGVGDKLPDITLKDEEDNDVQVVNLTAEKGIVLFSYPKASTPGCTTQANQFNRDLDKFTSKDYLVYGISTDSPAANKKFKEKDKMGFHLLSDQKRELLDVLGAKKATGGTLRSSWVIGKGGVIEMAKLGVGPLPSVSCALKHIGVES